MKENEKKSLLIFAPSVFDTGFRLGGAAVISIEGKKSFNDELALALGNKEIGILAAPGTMRGWVSEKNERRLKDQLFPMMLFYQLPEHPEEMMDAEDEISLIVKRVTGYHLRIKL